MEEQFEQKLESLCSAYLLIFMSDQIGHSCNIVAQSFAHVNFDGFAIAYFGIAHHVRILQALSFGPAADDKECHDNRYEAGNLVDPHYGTPSR